MFRLMEIPSRTLVRAAGYGLATGLVTGVLVAIPTDIIPNSYFMRMTPVRTQDYVFLALTVLLAALLGATYALPAACPLQEGKLAAGGFFSFLAVGCPVCNKVVVMLLGTAGAYSYFEPLQPVLAVVSLLLLIYAIRLRWRAIRGGLLPSTATLGRASEP